MLDTVRSSNEGPITQKRRHGENVAALRDFTKA
jgi:hypothetical protein